MGHSHRFTPSLRSGLLSNGAAVGGVPVLRNAGHWSIWQLILVDISRRYSTITGRITAVPALTRALDENAGAQVKLCRMRISASHHSR
jgi:hypothetical protein